MWTTQPTWIQTTWLGHEVTFKAALKTISILRTDLLNKPFLYKCTNVFEKILFFFGGGVQNFIMDLKSNVLKKVYILIYTNKLKQGVGTYLLYCD